MPRKIAGSEMITTEELNIAKKVPSVVFDRTTQRYRSDVLRCSRRSASVVLIGLGLPADD